MDDAETGIELPPELPDLDALVTEEDLLREAERMAAGVHRRVASAAAALAWKGILKEIHGRAGWRRLREGQRAEFVDRHVAKALADTEARAGLTARIAERLKVMKADASGATGEGQ